MSGEMDGVVTGHLEKDVGDDEHRDVQAVGHLALIGEDQGPQKGPQGDEKPPKTDNVCFTYVSHLGCRVPQMLFLGIIK